jgi:phytoene dehydrogenase-like protein
MTDPDVVIIGAGVAGLCTAAILSQQGKSVLVLERRPEIGGRISELTVDGYTLQWGGHILEDTGSGLGRVFESVGLKLETTGIRNDACPVYYGNEWHDIRDFYGEDKEEYKRIVSEIVSSEYSDFDKLDDLPLRTWLAQRTDSKGVISFMEHLGKIESMGGDYWWDLSASDFLYTRKLHYGETRVAGYSVWPKGGYVKICTDLAKVIEGHGGRIETGVSVARVLVTDGAARGVVVKRGLMGVENYEVESDTIQAGTVICSVPIWDALKVLPENDMPKWYVAQIREGSKLENRTFWLGIYAALDAPVYARSPRELTGWVNGPFTGLDGWSYMPSALDPSVAPEGKHLLCCGVVADPLNSRDPSWVNTKFDQLEEEMYQLLPDLKSHVLWMKRHRVLNYNIWQRPGLVGIYRPANKVPAVDGLWVVGDTYRSRMIGIDRSARSAMTVAEGVLERRLPAFGDTWRY